MSYASLMVRISISEPHSYLHMALTNMIMVSLSSNLSVEVLVMCACWQT